MWGALTRWHAPPKGGVGQETPPSALSVDDLPGCTDVVCLSPIVSAAARESG
jgi:hypothetical protein